MCSYACRQSEKHFLWRKRRLMLFPQCTHHRERLFIYSELKEYNLFKITMKYCFVFLLTFTHLCFGEILLGGWKDSSDQQLIDECLDKALKQIYQTNDNQVLRSRVSNILCKTQVVAGLNIRVTFNIDGQAWRCSYFKSLDNGLETLLEACHKVEETPTDSFIQNNVDQSTAATSTATLTSKSGHDESSTQAINHDRIHGKSDNDFNNFNEAAGPNENDDDDTDTDPVENLPEENPEQDEEERLIDNLRNDLDKKDDERMQQSY